MTDASTLAGEEVFGSFNNDITESKIVLEIILNCLFLFVLGPRFENMPN